MGENRVYKLFRKDDSLISLIELFCVACLIRKHAKIVVAGGSTRTMGKIKVYKLFRKDRSLISLNLKGLILIGLFCVASLIRKHTKRVVADKLPSQRSQVIVKKQPPPSTPLLQQEYQSITDDKLCCRSEQRHKHPKGSQASPHDFPNQPASPPSRGSSTVGQQLIPLQRNRRRNRQSKADHSVLSAGVTPEKKGIPVYSTTIIDKKKKCLHR